MSDLMRNRWVVTLAIIVGVLLEVIDSTVVNVALHDIIGSMGATLSDASWVVSGYTLANAIVLPISGWLGARFGSKRYFFVSIALFTIFSILCGLSTNLGELVTFRILQGLAGGGLLSTGQALLIGAWPKEQMGTAMAVFGIGIMFGPAIGPTLGGMILTHLSWSWIFFINVPVGIAAGLLVLFSVRPDRKSAEAQPVDWWGIALLAVAIGSLQFVVEKGQSENWFQTSYIAILSGMSLMASLAFIWREVSIAHPVVDLSMLASRNFSLGTIGTFFLGLVLQGSMIAMPLYCQNVLGCSALQAGQLMLPGAMASMSGSFAAGFFSKKNVSGGIQVCAGTFLVFVSIFRMGGATIQADAGFFYVPMILMGFGRSLIFVPLTTRAMLGLQGSEIGQASGINSLARQLGGSMGVAVFATALETLGSTFSSVLTENCSLSNPVFLERFQAMGGDIASVASGSGLTILRLLSSGASLQAQVLAFNRIFQVAAVLSFVVLPLFLLMRSEQVRLQPKSSQG